MKKRMRRRRKRRIRRDGSGNHPAPGSGSEEEFFKNGRGATSSNDDDYYYDEYESDRYSGDVLSSGLDEDENYFRRSKGILFEEKGAKGQTRTAAANRERMAQT
jgi:hypothetical protein